MQDAHIDAVAIEQNANLIIGRAPITLTLADQKMVAVESSNGCGVDHSMQMERPSIDRSKRALWAGTGVPYITDSVIDGNHSEPRNVGVQ